MDMTGGQIYDLLEQQWTGPELRHRCQGPAGEQRVLLPVEPGGRAGPRVIAGSVTLDGTPIADDASQTYRVVANNFLADGGDNFAASRARPTS